jgi:acetylornithine/succinyldiaminopimelate/putrescine aminotransferase
MTMNPDPKLQSVIATDDQYYLQIRPAHAVVIDHGTGVYLYDKAGRRYSI